MLTNTTATLYCRYHNPETNADEWHRVVLDAVHWEENKAENVIVSGLSSADAVTVYVPIMVRADGGAKRYVEPKRYAALSPADAASCWTMTPGKDRMIKGIAPETVPPLSISEITARYDACITVKSVDTRDYGNKHMQHWEVSGS